MRLWVKLKSGEDGILIGYGPGRKGRTMGMILVGKKVRAVKLQNFDVEGFAKIRAAHRAPDFDLGSLATAPVGVAH